MFLDLPDPDPLLRGLDPDPDPHFSHTGVERTEKKCLQNQVNFNTKNMLAKNLNFKN